MNRFATRGSATPPVFVFAGIVGLSIVFFLLFSAKNLFRKDPPPDSGTAPVTASTTTTPPEKETAGKPGDGTAGKAAGKPETSPPGEDPAGKPHAAYFTTAEAVLKDLTSRLRSGRTEDLTKTAGGGPRVDFLHQLLTKAGWTLPEGEPWSDEGAMTGVNRYGLKLEPSSPAVPLPAGPVMADVERTKTEGWKLRGLRFDPALVDQAVLLLKDAGITVEPAPLRDAADPLDLAHRFFDGVLGHDFKSARSLTDHAKVTHERLAGMCIVFEEGEYYIAAKRPIVITAGTADKAWAIVKIRSDKQNLDAEVGLEMDRNAAGAWVIQALDFTNMLESYVKATNTGNVFYSPVVKSAKGGESIVLYFEFDKSALHPRALRQLDIIASLLKSDPARKMRITGHSDALGRDSYNVKLSTARAKNVRTRLLELGVSATQIDTQGVGSIAPLDPDRREDGSDNPDGRSRNRRTEIYLDF